MDEIVSGMGEEELYFGSHIGNLILFVGKGGKCAAVVYYQNGKDSYYIERIERGILNGN